MLLGVCIGGFGRCACVFLGWLSGAYNGGLIKRLSFAGEF